MRCVTWVSPLYKLFIIFQAFFFLSLFVSMKLWVVLSLSNPSCGTAEFISVGEVQEKGVLLLLLLLF